MKVSHIVASFLFIAQVSAGNVAEQKRTAGSNEADADLKTCLGSEGECLNPDASQTNLSSDGTLTPTPGICLDDRDECVEHAARGDCKTNPNYMLAHCKLSCNSCPSNLKYFPNDYGEPQESSGENAAAVEKVIHETETYMKTKVLTKAMYHSVKENCLNRDKLCSKWASEGECKSNPLWMTLNCAPACQTCEKLDHRIRCPVNPHAPKAWGPGDADEMFERITSDPHYQQYKPNVLSRPVQEQSGVVPLFQEPKKEKNAPWMVALENFLTPEECSRMIYLGGVAGLKQSYEVGGTNFDGTYKAVETETRNSFNAWCFEKPCYEDKVTQQILAKVENVTGIPEKNAEFLQILRYEKGGLYKSHSDFIPTDLERAQGARVLTVLIYLNDVDEALGGQTYFPALDLTIQPKKGMALIFPNVYSQNPDVQDRRTGHAALTVKEGVKYAANLWFHQRDFKTPFYERCN